MRHPLTTAAALVAAPAAVLTGAELVQAQCLEGCTAIHTLIGEAGGDQFGWVSNDVGDIDHDGVSDFVLTAPNNDAGGSNAGRIYVYSGLTADELYRATGGGAGWWLGHDAFTAGDIDGLGSPDVIAGAPFSGAGRAVIYSSEGRGSVIHTFPGQSAGDQFGYRVGGGKDFDGDGQSDVVIGAPQNDGADSNAGRAYVYSGTDFALICSVDGPTSADLFGSGVALVGDLSDPPDGRSELLVGASNAGSGGGQAFVYSWDGEACQLVFPLIPPPGPATDFGLWFMNGCGDVNGDGTIDIYVNDYQVNRAHVFSGADGSVLWSFSGDGNGQFGIGRIVGDANGDGHADLLLAAWISSAGAPSAGKAFVYSGKTGVVLETFTHTVAGAGFGFDANGMGDVNGDGRSDYLITAASDLGSTGVAYVIAGTIAPVDLDGDGSVTVEDLVILILNWGACAGQPCLGDTNGDATVNVADMVSLILNWG